MKRPAATLRGLLAAILIPAAALLPACSAAFKEDHFVGIFEEAPGRKAPVQFYRFSLHGVSAFPSKTKFEAGWYDAKAVDRLFGQIKDTKVIRAERAERVVRTDGVPAIVASGEIPAQPAAQGAKPAPGAAKPAGGAKREGAPGEKAEAGQPPQPATQEAGKAQPRQPATQEAGKAQPRQPATQDAGKARPRQPATQDAGKARPRQPATQEAGKARPRQPATQEAEKARPPKDGAKDGKTALKATHARVELASGQFSVALQGIRRIRAERVLVKVRNKGDDPPQIREIRLHGRVTLTFADESASKMLDALRKEVVTGTIMPAGAKGGLSAKNLGKLEVTGGAVEVMSDNLALGDQKWHGACLHASTRSMYHDFSWSGGIFEASAVTATKLPASLSLRGGHATFHDVGALVSGAGWLLKVTRASLRPSGVKIACSTGPDGWALEPEEGELAKAPDGLLGDKYAKKLREKRDDASARWQRRKGEVKLVLDLRNAEFSLEFGNGPVTCRIPKGVGKEKKCVEALVKAYEADSIDVSGVKSFVLRTEHARSDVVTRAPAASVSRTRKLYCRFGPEGEARAQHENERFVIFMTSNPRALTRRIKALANSRSVRDSVARIVYGPMMTEHDTKITQAKAALGKAKDFANSMKERLASEGADVIELKRVWSGSLRSHE